MNRIRATLLVVLWTCSALVGCGGDADGPVEISAGKQTTEGIIAKVTGSTEVLTDLPEGKGSLLLDVTHTDRLVNKKVKVTIHPADDPEAVSAKGEGNQDFVLDPGDYNATIRYVESELAGGGEGGVRGLRVHAGHISNYKVFLNAPVGLLRMRFKVRDVPVSSQVKIWIYAEKKDGNDRKLLWEGPAGEHIALPTGIYRVKAVYDDGNNDPVVQWFKELEIGEGLAKNEQEHTLQVDFSGLLLNAYNYGRDVNERSRIYFYRPGVRIEQAVAVAQGPAGEPFEIDPGFYDVRVVYLPSENSIGIRGDKTIPNVEIVEKGTVQAQIDLEQPMASIKLTLHLGDDDISDKAEIRAMKSGADLEAASAILDEVGVSEHYIPAGKYDIFLTYKPLDGAMVKRRLRNVNLANGYTWEQTFDLSDAVLSSPTVNPPTGDRTVVETKVFLPGASTGDDDDSAGGGDEVLEAPSPSEEAGE